ncbi:MAG: B12-binding domain-containing radical SAM protein, partial [Burkholderiales bacterium]
MASFASRRIAFVCMTPSSDANEHAVEMPSYGVRRVLAAAAADPELREAKFALIDVRRPDVEAYVEAILSFEPDLIGFSIYVWSMPCLVEVARRIKRLRPGCMIVFGGPSARTASFELPMFLNSHTYADAVVATEGETVFRDIARLPQLARAALEAVPGLDLPVADGWRKTARRAPIAQLDEIPSPYQLGLMGKGDVAYLETFRGCPFSCAFCEWGASDPAKTVFSAAYIERELQAFAKHGVPAIFLVDAGLNLNNHAFRNLKEAADRTGLLRNMEFW